MGISQVAWGVDLSTPLSKAVAVLLTLLHLQLKYLGFTFDRSPFKVACKIEIPKKKIGRKCVIFIFLPNKRYVDLIYIYIYSIWWYDDRYLIDDVLLYIILTLIHIIFLHITHFKLYMCFQKNPWFWWLKLTCWTPLKVKQLASFQ